MIKAGFRVLWFAMLITLISLHPLVNKTDQVSSHKVWCVICTILMLVGIAGDLLLGMRMHTNHIIFTMQYSIYAS